MREIKFRGKEIKTGKWIYGSLVVDNKGRCFIVPFQSSEKGLKCIEVDKSTVGQFTGLRDREGREIYEGDIIETEYDRWLVKFDNGSFYGVKPKTGSFLDLSKETINYYDAIVVGNVFDNPELLQEGVNHER